MVQFGTMVPEKKGLVRSVISGFTVLGVPNQRSLQNASRLQARGSGGNHTPGGENGMLDPLRAPTFPNRMISRAPTPRPVLRQTRSSTACGCPRFASKFRSSSSSQLVSRDYSTLFSITHTVRSN